MTTLSRGSVAPSARRRALALWIVLAAQLMLAMDLMIVVAALPRPPSRSKPPKATPNGRTDLGAALKPRSCWMLGDMIGHVRAFRIGLIVFVAASLLGGMAHLPSILIAARVVQGIGAALAAPSVLALVMVMARDEAEQANGLSLFIAVSAAGASSGLILGGILTDFLSWRWALLINVPVGALVVIAIGHLVAETHPKRARLDVIGALTATIGSGALTYGFISAADNGWMATATVSSFVIAVILFTLFVRTERSHPAPLLDLSLLQDGSRLAALAVMALIVGMHFAMLFMLVQYLQRVLGWTPLGAGLGYLPLTLTVSMIPGSHPG